ncbi:MAG: hypothetical protein KAI15_02585 [Gammaproteobacteria bacterium]|nr:hypothetical protein [Gammaproteobacteria bacterium]MCK5497766.1 hypothetical protein [Gammaproteobacteria bacterium]MCK5667944.1 hypothetical protein [Gammaproteobacteria bacterium]
MREIYFGEFRVYVIEHIKAIEAQDPEYQSIEWFLLRYLRKIEKNSNPPTTPGKVEGSMRGMVRFYVDMIDEDSELGDRCKKVYAEYRKSLRFSQEN